MSANVEQEQKKVVFNEERCKGCSLCVISCPRNLLVLSERLNDQGYPVVEITDMERCNSCSICAKMCPDIAIEVWR